MLMRFWRKRLGWIACPMVGFTQTCSKIFGHHQLALPQQLPHGGLFKMWWWWWSYHDVTTNQMLMIWQWFNGSSCVENWGGVHPWMESQALKEFKPNQSRHQHYSGFLLHFGQASAWSRPRAITKYHLMWLKHMIMMFLTSLSNNDWLLTTKMRLS